MALATRCPYCQTTFRVVQDQLKLFNGIVRCGACKQIFNGVEQLLPGDAAEPSGLTERTDSNFPDRQQRPALHPGISPDIPDAPPDSQLSNPHNEPIEDLQLILSADDSDPSSAASSLDGTPDPFFVPTAPPPPRTSMHGTPNPGDLKLDLRKEPQLNPQEPDTATAPSNPETTASPAHEEFVSIIQSMQSKTFAEDIRQPPDQEDAKSLSDEPEFMKQARRQQRFGRIWRYMMFLGILLMLPLLLMQSVDVFHDRIIAALPWAKPLMAPLCKLTGCQTVLQRQIDDVSVEVSELQAPGINESSYTLNLVLRNRSASAQTWPNIELTLNEASEKALARKIVTASDYLTDQQAILKGFPATSEQSIKLAFDLEQIKPAGYRVYLFYP